MLTVILFSMTPVLEDVRDITIAQTTRGGLVALVSYEHKVCVVAESIDGVALTISLLGPSTTLETRTCQGPRNQYHCHFQAYITVSQD